MAPVHGEGEIEAVYCVSNKLQFNTYRCGNEDIFCLLLGFCDTEGPKMKNLMKLAFLSVLLLVHYSNGEECESIPFAKEAMEKCTTPVEQGGKGFSKTDKCFPVCLQREWGELDENDRLSIELIDKVFDDNIKNEDTKKKLSEIHAKCVKEARPHEDVCDMSEAYRQCVSDDEDMKEIAATKYCKDTADYLIT